MTVRTRITLFMAGAGLVFGLLFSLAVSEELIEQPFDILDSVLEEEAYETTRFISNHPTEPDGSPAGSALHSLDRYWIEIYDRGAGTMLFRSRKARSIKLPAVRPGSGSVAHVDIPQDPSEGGRGNSGEVAFRIRTYSFAFDGRTFVVQIARDIEKLHEEIRDLVYGIVAALVLSTLGLFAVSRFLAGRILRPIGRMKDLAQDISERNLDRRIPAEEGRDEFDELARTINRMLDRLQFSFVRQREFLFDTSHELKTPLTTMRLAVDEISASETESLPTFARENILRLKSQVLRMERLIKDLLNLSSLESLAGIDPKPVRLDGLLSSLADEYKFLADARDIGMDIRLPEEMTVQGDSEKLRRAFSNLLDNAVKYNVSGGRIEVTGERLADGITVTVGNSGSGVAAAEIPKVFDQFYRAERSRSTLHGGSGLGLAIVKQIVELHGGTVEFESRQGIWTRVRVFLPSRRGS